MGGGERWNERLIRLRQWAREKMRPYPIAPPPPKHWRNSGPRLVPSDWMADKEYQALLGPQCEACHQNLVYGQQLDQGRWCAQCSPRIRRTVNGPSDLPPAA